MKDPEDMSGEELRKEAKKVDKRLAQFRAVLLRSLALEGSDEFAYRFVPESQDDFKPTTGGNK